MSHARRRTGSWLRPSGPLRRRVARPRPGDAPWVQLPCLVFFSMKRDFIELSSLSTAELDGLLRLGARLKTELKTGLEHPYLRGKTLAMSFQKPSFRPRITFETGIAQLGGAAMYLPTPRSCIG